MTHERNKIRRENMWFIVKWPEINSRQKIILSWRHVDQMMDMLSKIAECVMFCYINRDIFNVINDIEIL